jgi:ribosomal protein L31
MTIGLESVKRQTKGGVVPTSLLVAVLLGAVEGEAELEVTVCQLNHPFFNSEQKSHQSLK